MRSIEQWNRVRAISISKDWFLGEDQYAESQRQLKFDDHTLVLCHLATLNAWDKVEESGKKSESFTKIIQGPKEAYTVILERLASDINRIVYPEVRQN